MEPIRMHLLPRGCVSRLASTGFVALLLALLLGNAPMAMARSAASQHAPNPNQCRVPPVPTSDLLTWLATPPSSPPPAVNRSGTPTFKFPPPLPAGPPPSSEVGVAITNVWNELYACTNAGDIRRQAALFTPQEFRRWYGGGDTARLATLVANPTPLPSNQRRVPPPLTDMRLLPDGRVGALIDLTAVGLPAAPENKDNNYVIFAPSGGGWLIDDIEAFIG